LIEQEILASKEGKLAKIIIKVNSLIDQPTIDALYKASQSGVKVELIVRGICGLIPGVKGLSDNIKVRSILGRFLEHSRVFYFHNAAEGHKLYIGSADWMPRNFLRRVEAVFPIEEPGHINSILKDLDYIISDNESASLLKKDGSYSKVKPSSRTKIKISSQSSLIEDSKSRIDELKTAKSAASSRKTDN
jgi:polyphosphate kinase